MLNKQLKTQKNALLGLESKTESNWLDERQHMLVSSHTDCTAAYCEI